MRTDILFLLSLNIIELQTELKFDNKQKMRRKEKRKQLKNNKFNCWRVIFIQYFHFNKNNIIIVAIWELIYKQFSPFLKVVSFMSIALFSLLSSSFSSCSLSSEHSSCHHNQFSFSNRLRTSFCLFSLLSHLILTNIFCFYFICNLQLCK